MDLKLPRRNAAIEKAHWHGNFTVKCYSNLRTMLRAIKSRIKFLESHKHRYPPSFFQKERKRLGMRLLEISSKVRTIKGLLRSTNLFY